MAKGLKIHQEQLNKLSALGKDLARRAKSKCELCDGCEGKLTLYEVEPFPTEPSRETTLLICGICRDGIEKNHFDPNRWRFLESVIWSELPALQVTAVRICRKIASDGVAWAQELLESVYLSPEVEDWLEK